MKKTYSDILSSIISVRFINGIVFLLLFIFGFFRYRFGLMFVLSGIISCIRRYNIIHFPEREINWKMLNNMVYLLWIIATFFDIKYGQLFPKYPNLIFWQSAGIGLAGFLSSFILSVECARLAQKIADNAVFIICPNCSFENMRIVRRCINCNYIKGMPIEEIEKCIDPSKDIKLEINDYMRNGMLKKVPKEVLRGIRLLKNEHILIALSSYNKLHLSYMEKNNKRKPHYWLIITTQKIIYYYGLSGLKGWEGKDLVPYSKVKQIRVTPAKIKPKLKKMLVIDTENDSYEILFGIFTKDYFKRANRGPGGRHTNELLLNKVLKCIEKRRRDIDN